MAFVIRSKQDGISCQKEEIFRCGISFNLVYTLFQQCYFQVQCAARVLTIINYYMLALRLVRCLFQTYQSANLNTDKFVQREQTFAILLLKKP